MAMSNEIKKATELMEKLVHDPSKQFAVGNTCKIFGLQSASAQQWNGAVATIQEQYEPIRGRWAVRVKDDKNAEHTIKVRPCNMMLEPQCFEMTKVENKGLGWVATRNIPMGCVVFVEEAVICMDQTKFRSKQARERHLLSLLSNLSEEKRKECFDLYDCKPGSNLNVTQEIVDIFDTNSVACEPHSFAISGLFLKTSRINHACCPNLRKYVFKQGSTYYLVTIAAKVIKKGEEMCISYIEYRDPQNEYKLLNYHQRQRILEKTWNFSCKCESMCKNNIIVKKSNAIINQLNNLFMQGADASKRIDCAKKMIAIAVENKGMVVSDLWMEALMGLVGVYKQSRKWELGMVYLNKMMQSYWYFYGIRAKCTPCQQSPEKMELLQYSQMSRSPRVQEFAKFFLNR